MQEAFRTSQRCIEQTRFRCTIIKVCAAPYSISQQILRQRAIKLMPVDRKSAGFHIDNKNNWEFQPFHLMHSRYGYGVWTTNYIVRAYVISAFCHLLEKPNNRAKAICGIDAEVYRLYILKHATEETDFAHHDVGKTRLREPEGIKQVDKQLLGKETLTSCASGLMYTPSPISQNVISFSHVDTRICWPDVRSNQLIRASAIYRA